MSLAKWSSVPASHTRLGMSPHACTGPYTDDGFVGEYTITGGTGDFHGAKGYIYDQFDEETGYSVRQIYIE